MTRKIPWRDGISAKTTSRISSISNSPSPAVTRRLKVNTEDSDAESKVSPSSVTPTVNANRQNLSEHMPAMRAHTRCLQKELERSRGGSQPPEPLNETYMVDGLDGDDMYRMVEDEFYLTANKFTAHLHAAEYQKLQVEAKTHNAATIKNISRPVVGRMTGLVKKKHERASRVRRQKLATNERAGDDDTDEDDVLKSTSLFGLMASPRKKIPRLDHFVQGPTMTKAPSLLNVSPQTPIRSLQSDTMPARDLVSAIADRKSTRKPVLFESEGEDDLDITPRRNAITVSESQLGHKFPSETSKPVDAARPLGKPIPTKPVSSRVVQQDATEVQSSDDDSDGALFGFQRRAKSRARQKETNTAAGNKAHSKSNRDYIPGFL